MRVGASRVDDALPLFSLFERRAALGWFALSGAARSDPYNAISQDGRTAPNRGSEVLSKMLNLFSGSRAAVAAVDLNAAAKDVIALCRKELQRNGISLED